MKYNQALIKFMQKSIQHECIVQSWGINRIQVSDRFLYFHVTGFNYSGTIMVTPGEDNKTIILNSTKEYIGSANTAIEAIKLLDKYIESNEEKYLGLFDALIE